MEGAQERRTKVMHDVTVVLHGFDKEAVGALETALHRADRTLGVIVVGGAPRRFILLTYEQDEASARRYAPAIMSEAARLAGIDEAVIAQASITEVERRVRDVTGRPRRYTGPLAGARVIDLGERGQLHARREGPMGEWIIQREGQAALSGRALTGVLHMAFEMPHGRKPQWFEDLVAELEGLETAIGLRFPCPCCDILTLSKPTSSASHEICKVCFWENDGVQFNDLDYGGGANKPSLRTARENYRQFGACEQRVVQYVREPLAAEIPTDAS